jgi:hypothetical protein
MDTGPIVSVFNSLLTVGAAASLAAMAFCASLHRAGSCVSRPFLHRPFVDST